MKLQHQIVGYDRKTERLAVEYDVPSTSLRRIGAVIEAPKDDPDLIGSYPLRRDQVERIAEILRRPIDSDKFDFFIEPAAR